KAQRRKGAKTQRRKDAKTQRKQGGFSLRLCAFARQFDFLRVLTPRSRVTSNAETDSTSLCGLPRSGPVAVSGGGAVFPASARNPPLRPRSTPVEPACRPSRSLP